MRTPPRYTSTPARRHEVMDAHGNPIGTTLHRGDGEDTRHWFLRCEAADKAAAARSAAR